MSEKRERKPDANDIPVGRDFAISRAALARKWGVSDRKARHMIAQLRADDNGDDLVIVSHSSGSGYFRTNNPAEIEHFVREMTKRARNTFAPLKKARRVLKEGGSNG